MCTLHIYPLSSPTEYSASQSTFLGKDYEDDNNNDKDDDGDSGSDGVSSGSDSNHAASKLGACFCCTHKFLIKIDKRQSAFTLFVNFNC